MHSRPKNGTDWLIDPHGRLAEAEVFFWHLRALVLPGRDVPVFDVHPKKPEPLNGWQAEDIKLLIDEGRRQVDRQQSDLTHVRMLAQFLFTTAMVVTALLVAGLHRIGKHGGLLAILVWAAGTLTAFAGLLGAGAVMVVKGQFGTIDAALLTALPPPISAEVAAAYSRIVRYGENTIATRQTVLRDAVSLVVLAGVIDLMVWLLTLL